MIDISLIVACYNIENYIGDCLNSIFREIRAEHAGRIEILVVNDGSTDTTPAAIDAALKQYDRYQNARLISHENMGLAASWNDAIAQANGQFVGFLDGDDLMLEGYFTTLLAQIDHTPQTDVIELTRAVFRRRTILSIRRTIPFYKRIFTRWPTRQQRKNRPFTLKQPGTCGHGWFAPALPVRCTSLDIVWWTSAGPPSATGKAMKSAA